MLNSKIRSILMQTTVALLLICLSFYYLLPPSIPVWALSLQNTAVCDTDTKTLDTSCIDNHKEDIPNIVHLVYILKNPNNADFAFHFSHFLSLYAVWWRWKPDTIYLHTNVDANSPIVQRAKAGDSGKWTQKFFNMPVLVVNTVSVPTHTNSGVKIASVVHQSDFVRVKAVHDYGGIYIDMDVHALQDVQALRKSGYNAIGGLQAHGQLNSGTFMSQKHGRLISLWMERMHQVYDGGWTTHSNKALTNVVNELKNDKCEALALPQAAFAPVGWKWYDQERLFGHHYPPSNVGYANHDDKLEDFSSNAGSMWQAWSHNFGCTYLLHAFSSQKPRNGVTDNGITPRTVLERRSVFARAVYPILQDMYERGYVEHNNLF